MYKWRPLTRGTGKTEYRYTRHCFGKTQQNDLFTTSVKPVKILDSRLSYKVIFNHFCKKKKKKRNKKRKKQVTVYSFKSRNNANEWVLYYILIHPFGKPRKIVFKGDNPLIEFLSWLLDQKYLITSMGQTGRKMKGKVFYTRGKIWKTIYICIILCHG